MAYPGYQPPNRTSIGPPSKSKDQIARELDAARGRKEFFSNRPDVSDDRAYRRMKQFDEMRSFKNKLIDSGRVLKGTRPDGSTYTVMNSNTGEPVFLTDRPGGRSVSDVAQDLAFRFGPTPREVASDMGYAIGSMGKGLGQFIGKGGVIGNVISDLYNRFKGGTQQGIETVKGLYDNLRTTLSGQPTVSQAMGSIPTQEELAMLPFLSQPGFGYQAGEGMQVGPVTEIKSKPPIPDQFRNIGDESDPSIFGLTNYGVPVRDLPTRMSDEEFDDYYKNIIPDRNSGNPLFNQQFYEPFRVSDMDITGLTAQNLIDPTRVGQTVSDYYDAALQGVDIETPIGKLNLNPMARKVFLDGRMGNLNYGGSFDPDTSDYNVGIGTQLPYGVGLSLGASSNNIPGMSFNKYIGPVNTSLNLSEQGGSVGLNTIVDPLRAVYPNSAIGVPINVGASVDSTGRITPNIGLAVPFKDGGSVDKYAGLGYKLK